MPPKLETFRLILRDLRTSDLIAVFDYSSQPEYSQFLPYPTPTSLEDFQSIFQNLLVDENSYLWAITLKSDGQLIGLIELSLNSLTEASLHYEIDRQFWNQGFATESTQTVIVWTCENLPQILHLTADTHSANFGSQQVMQKSGMNLIRTEVVTWEKFEKPVQLLIYQIDRPIFSTADRAGRL